MRVRSEHTEIPEVMTTADVARWAGFKSRSGARRAIKRGDYGSYSKVGGRIRVRRESFLAALEAAEVEFVPLARPVPVPHRSPYVRALLR